MDQFLESPNESNAAIMLATQSLPGLISSCQSPDQSSELLRLLFQLNSFNIFFQLGTEGVAELLRLEIFKHLTLEHLKGIDFPAQDNSSVITQLFTIFSSEDIRASNLSKDILVHKLGHHISQEPYTCLFSNLLNSDDSVLKIRGLELIIELANNYNFEFFERNGFIDQGIEMATGDDILLKIVAVEVIAELGNSEAGCKKLLGAKIRTVIKSAIEEEVEVHMRNKLILLSSKIFSFTGNDFLIDGKFWEVLEGMIGTNDPSTVKNGLGAICYLMTRPQGVQQIFARASLVEEWTRLQRTVNSAIKAMFYHTFAEITKLITEENMIDYARAIPYLRYMMDELVNPFQETHLDILKAMASVARWQFQALAMISEPRFKEYLFKRPPHQIHEISYLKYELAKELDKQELPELFKERLRKYLKAGVFAAEGELDREIESLA